MAVPGKLQEEILLVTSVRKMPNVVPNVIPVGSGHSDNVLEDHFCAQKCPAKGSKCHLKRTFIFDFNYLFWLIAVRPHLHHLQPSPP